LNVRLVCRDQISIDLADSEKHSASRGARLSSGRDSLVAGADDKIFRLDRIDPHECASLRP
jgi:hypothetical protein